MAFNSFNVVEMDWVDQYDMDAAVWVAGTGVNGFEALGYKFYETAAVEGVIDYDKIVNTSLAAA